MSATITDNTLQAATDLAREAEEIDRKTFCQIRDKSLLTFAHMLRNSPFLTGNYRANMRMALNERPEPYRITGKRAGLPKELRGYRSSNRELLNQIRPYYQKIIDEHTREARALWKGKKLSDLHEIIIFNDAAHAHFVERGGPRQKAYWVFARGAEMARANLTAVTI